MADRISLPAGIGLAKRRGTVNFGTQIVGRILSINNIEIWAKQDR
jgi:translation initiation factor 6 (eIF-6)